LSSSKKPWFVYIVETEKGVLYTGITTDVERRFSEHCDSKKGAKFFRGHKPKKVVYRETCKDRSTASKREYEIKKMTRDKKLKLIEGYTSKISPS